MGQIKVFGLKSELNQVKSRMSDVIHSCIVNAFKLPLDKKFQRFFPLDSEDFYFSSERSNKYTIVEVSIFEGRSVEAKKEFITLMFQRFNDVLDIQENDLEITIIETPKCNWGIRGLPADELTLSYKVNV